MNVLRHVFVMFTATFSAQNNTTLGNMLQDIHTLCDAISMTDKMWCGTGNM